MLYSVLQINENHVKFLNETLLSNQSQQLDTFAIYTYIFYLTRAKQKESVHNLKHEPIYRGIRKKTLFATNYSKLTYFLVFYNTHSAIENPISV